MQRMLKLAENNVVSYLEGSAEFHLHDELYFCFFAKA